MDLDVQKLIESIQEQHPNVVKRHKRFWRQEFSEIFHNFIKSSTEEYFVIEETDPFKIDRCPKCKVVIIPHDNYCSACGVKLRWR